MFSSILSSGPIDWEKATTERKLQALERLPATDPALAQLAVQDADAVVRHRAMQLMEPAALWNLVATVQSGDEDILAARLAEQPADPGTSAGALPAALQHASTPLRVALIAHTRSEDLAAALVAALEQDADRASVVRGTGLIGARAAAARAMWDVALLEALAQEYRDKQRQIYRAARGRADELLAARESHHRARALCEQLEGLVAREQLTLTAVVNAEREFQALSPLPVHDDGAQLQSRYDKVLATCRELLQGQAEIGRDIERIKAGINALAERSQADAALEPEALAALIDERTACAKLLSDSKFDALARERSALLASLEKLTERHAVLEVESRALVAARGHVEALRADIAILSPAWREEFARTIGIIRPALRAAVEEAAQAIIAPIEAQKQQQHEAERAAGQQARQEIEALVKLLEVSLDKGQHQQAHDLGLVLEEKRAATEGQRALPAALEFRIKRCRERLAKLGDWKRFGDMKAREALCREAEALAKRVERQEQPAAGRFIAPLETFAWPVSPEPVQPAAAKAPAPGAGGFIAPLETFAWPTSPEPVQPATDEAAAPETQTHAPVDEAAASTAPADAAALPADASAQVQPALNTEQIAQAVRELQARWQQLDAAKGASTKGLWERFRRACDRAYAPVRRHVEALEQQRAGNAEKKNAILDKLEALRERIADGANWGRLLSERGELLRGWFEAGTLPRKQAQAMQKRYEALTKEIDAKLNARRRAERARRDALIVQARAIAEKPADGASMAAMIALQKQWQEGIAGAIRLKAGEDQALWEAFRAAGSALFGKRDAEKAEREAGRNAQLAERRALINEVQALAKGGNQDNDAGDNKGNDIAALKRGLDELGARWQAMPWPERKPLREVEQKYSAARTAVMDRIAAIRRQAEDDKRAAAFARLAVVERAEQALGSGGTPDLDAVRAELQSSLNEGEKLDATVTARLASLEAALKAGPDAWRAQADKTQAERDALLLELEIVLNLPSPPELQSERRMRMLKRLAESKNSRSTPPLMAPDAPKAIARLLALPMAMHGAQARVEAILGAAGTSRK